MKIIPYEKYTIKCNLASEEVLSKLREYTEPRKAFRIGVGNKIFQGLIFQDSFKIYRQISYRNSFIPQIKGNLTQESGKTKIDIRMHLHPFVIIFMTIWFSGVLIASIASFFTLLSDNTKSDNFDPGLLIPLGMLIFGMLLCTIPFWYEVKKAKIEFNRIFNVYLSDENEY